MSVDTDNMCRLCFAKEDRDNDVVLSEIHQYLPFLDLFVGVSHDDCMPQKICSTCEFQIESSQLLRKRVKMTETLWSKIRKPKPEASLEVLLNCHLCNSSFDYDGLILHIENSHGKNHCSDCDLCGALLSDSVHEGPMINHVVGDVKVEQFEEEKSEAESEEDPLNQGELYGTWNPRLSQTPAVFRVKRRKRPKVSRDAGLSAIHGTDPLIVAQTETFTPSNENPVRIGPGFGSQTAKPSLYDRMEAFWTVTSTLRGKRTFSCNLCPYKIDQLCNIRSHLSRRHGTAINPNLNARTRHPGLKSSSYSCDVCAKTFRDISDLRRHQGSKRCATVAI